ncbi:MAG: hypothetical protein WBM65_19985 [Sedimenticolaceae bacterium]
MAANQDLIRLKQLLRLVAKEDHHLRAVRDRFFPEGIEIDVAWLTSALESDIGVDRLESFSAKFARMQDTVIDKLLPQLLKTAGETPMAAIDNLNRAERLGFLADTDTWLQMRRLRKGKLTTPQGTDDTAVRLFRGKGSQRYLPVGYTLDISIFRAKFSCIPELGLNPNEQGPHQGVQEQQKPGGQAAQTGGTTR